MILCVVLLTTSLLTPQQFKSEIKEEKEVQTELLTKSMDMPISWTKNQMLNSKLIFPTEDQQEKLIILF